MIPTTKSKAKEETNQGPIKETSIWAQQRATQRRGWKPDGWSANREKTSSFKTSKVKVHVGGSQGVFMRLGKSGLRVTFDTTLSELTIKDSNVICATKIKDSTLKLFLLPVPFIKDHACMWQLFVFKWFELAPATVYLDLS